MTKCCQSLLSLIFFHIPLHSIGLLVGVRVLILPWLIIFNCWPCFPICSYILVLLDESQPLTSVDRLTLLLLIVLCLPWLLFAFFLVLYVSLLLSFVSTFRGVIRAYKVSSALQTSSTLSMNSGKFDCVLLAISSMKGLMGHIPHKKVASVIFSSCFSMDSHSLLKWVRYAFKLLFSCCLMVRRYVASHLCLLLIVNYV